MRAALLRAAVVGLLAVAWFALGAPRLERWMIARRSEVGGVVISVHDIEQTWAALARERPELVPGGEPGRALRADLARARALEEQERALMDLLGAVPSGAQLARAPALAARVPSQVTVGEVEPELLLLSRALVGRYGHAVQPPEASTPDRLWPRTDPRQGFRLVAALAREGELEPAQAACALGVVLELMDLQRERRRLEERIVDALPPGFRAEVLRGGMVSGPGPR